MRTTAFILLVTGLHVSAMGYSQKVTLTMHDQPLEKVILEISRQSGVEVLYNNDLLRKAGRVSISVEDADVEEALSRALQKTGLSIRKVEGMLVISPRADGMSGPTDLPAPFLVITGKVTDKDGKPLASVSISNLTQKKKGTQTDAQGNFSIEAGEKDVLEFSIVGFAPQRYTVTGGKTTISVILGAQASDLTEIVMIGYGSSQRKDLTGSVSTVSGKEIEDLPFNTVDNAIAGKAAGVQVTKTDGSPGGAVRIRVRGSSSLLGGNDPLYVIDGVPQQVQSNYVSPGYDVGNPVGNDISGQGGVSLGMSTGFVNGLNSLGGLNPDDIESVTILKDASASAIYGSKAANGVVIITTKKGRKDMKPQITFNYYGTVSNMEKKPHLLDLQQYKTLLTESAVNDNAARDLAGSRHQTEADAIVNTPDQFFSNGNTDWLDQVTRTAFAHNGQIAVQGGSASSRYYTSIAYTTMPGIVKGTDYSRLVGKVSLENEIGKKFRFLTDINIGYTNQNITNGAYDEALKARPDYTPYDSTGNYTNFANVGYSYQGFQNPVALLTAINNSKNTSILGSLSAVYDVTPALELKSTVSLNDQIYNQRTYTPSYVEIGSFYGSVASNGGIGSDGNSRFADWFLENTATYKKEWRDKHAVNILAGTSYETVKTSSFSATASGYPNDNVLNNLSSATTPISTKADDPSGPQSYLLSFYLRANYTYMDRYLFTFTGRADGSSKFGPDNKFGYFPSGAFAWRLSQESFLKDVSWIDDIKIRVSYGLTGNQNIGNQMYRTLYTPTSYAGGSALIPTQLGNPAIKWETTKQTDIGLDYSLFKNRLHGTVDYYNKQTDDALLNLPVAPSSSYSTLLANTVGLRNRGLEVYLQGDILRGKNFRWSMSGNISWNRSIVTRLSSTADLSQITSPTGLEYGNTTLIEGKPLGLLQGMKVTGIIRDQQELTAYQASMGTMAGALPYLGIGDPMFQLDTVTYKQYGGNFPSTHALIGNAAPNYFGGFSEVLSYKNFDLSLNFLFSEGGKLMWGDDVSSVSFVGTSNANASMLKRYNAQNTGSGRPRLLFGGDQFIYNSSLSVYNSSYLKLRTVMLNYRFDKTGWMTSTGVQAASLYVSATNLFTITKYPGNDPETSDDSYSVAGGYFDVSNYPAVRTVSVGIKVAF